MFVRLFVVSSVSLFPWWVGWLGGSVHVCLHVFLAYCGTFEFVCLNHIFGDRVVPFLNSGEPWETFVTLGAPFWHPWLKFYFVFNTWRTLGAQFYDAWAPFDHFWSSIFVSFERSAAGPWIILRLFWKRFKKEKI